MILAPSIARRGKTLIGLLARFQDRRIVRILTRTLSEWSDDKVPRLSASLAFYALLSLAPLLLVFVAVAALAYGADAARGQLVWEIRSIVGVDSARTIQDLLRNAYKPFSGALATLIGISTVLFGATSVIVELRDALNTIWHVPMAPGNSGYSGLRQLVKDRFYSFGIVLGGGFLLLVSLSLNAFIAAIGKFFGHILPASEFTLQATAFATSLLMTIFLFAAIYKLLPDVNLGWSDVIIGAAVTAFLFELGKTGNRRLPGKEHHRIGLRGSWIVYIDAGMVILLRTSVLPGSRVYKGLYVEPEAAASDYAGPHQRFVSAATASRCLVSGRCRGGLGPGIVYQLTEAVRSRRPFVAGPAARLRSIRMPIAAAAPSPAIADTGSNEAEVGLRMNHTSCRILAHS